MIPVPGIAKISIEWWWPVGPKLQMQQLRGSRSSKFFSSNAAKLVCLNTLTASFLTTNSSSLWSLYLKKTGFKKLWSTGDQHFTAKICWFDRCGPWRMHVEKKTLCLELSCAKVNGERCLTCWFRVTWQLSSTRRRILESRRSMASERHLSWLKT